MSRLVENILSPAGLKTILFLKLLVISGFVLVETKVVYFGEKSIDAQESDGEAAVANDEADSVMPSETASDESKSYLERLLDLPKFENDKIKKSEVSKYLDILERKRSQVEQRINTLADREKALGELQNTIKQKITYLEEERRFFAESIQKEKEMKQERLDDLISFYQKMGPKKAAPVFEKLDKDLVVKLFKNMPVKQTTSILQLMNPDRSVELSEYYGRLKSGKEYDLLKEVNQSLVDEFKEKCED